MCRVQQCALLICTAEMRWNRHCRHASCVTQHGPQGTAYTAPHTANKPEILKLTTLVRSLRRIQRVPCVSRLMRQVVCKGGWGDG